MEIDGRDTGYLVSGAERFGWSRTSNVKKNFNFLLLK